MTRLRLWLDALRTSLWFIPMLIVLSSAALAYAIPALDAWLPSAWWRGVPALQHLLEVPIAGASAMLQVIGGSMITVAGTVFSITVASLTLASGQYTSRVLRNFIRDRANQAVLGTFLGIFVYSLLVLRSLSSLAASGHAPALAMLVALVLAFLGIAILIFFIHHIVLNLQATRVVARIAEEVLASIDRYFPEHAEDGGEARGDDVDLGMPPPGNWYPVVAARSGYITAVDLNGLASLATELTGLVRVRGVAGRFVAAGEVLADVRSAEAPDEQSLQRVRSHWSFGAERTLSNDPGYGIRQLVDVALKALSPGVNETTTAVMCVNWLGVLLLRMAGRRMPPRLIVREGHPRVMTGAHGFGDLLAEAFDQIRQDAAGNVAVLLRMLEVLDALAAGARANVRRTPLLRQVDALAALVESSVPWPPDREPLRQRIGALHERLGVSQASADQAPATDADK